jgi:hypothetical protein
MAGMYFMKSTPARTVFLRGWPARLELNMFKLVVILECDICGDTFHRMATSTDRNPEAWDDLSLLLVAKAENACWSNYSAHHCPICIETLSSSATQSADKSLSQAVTDEF